MPYIYSDPSRASDPHALPDIEVFHVTVPRDTATAEFPQSGWYWQPCFPGCLPDGEATGPFESQFDAEDDARRHAE